MSRRCRFSILIAASLAVLAIGVSAATAGARWTSCNVGNGRGHGYSYLYPLKVLHTKCRTGWWVVNHHRHPREWRCHTHIVVTGVVQRDGNVLCKSGSRRVSWSFVQNTH
jgi:hypothetical protein